MSRDRETLTFLPDPLVDHSWIELHQHKHLQGKNQSCSLVETNKESLNVVLTSTPCLTGKEQSVGEDW